MAKYYGAIGFAESKEKLVMVEGQPVHSGIYEDQITERKYRGDILREIMGWRSSQKVNDDLTPSNRISIVSDGFALENISFMRYIIWNSTYWKIASIEVQRPRLVLTLGGVYDGPKANSPE